MSEIERKKALLKIGARVRVESNLVAGKWDLEVLVFAGTTGTIIHKPFSSSFFFYDIQFDGVKDPHCVNGHDLRALSPLEQLAEAA